MDADRIADKLKAQEAAAGLSKTRGFRTNNPFNLRNGGTLWQGQIGVHAYGMCIFDSPENGIRAGCKQLLVYQDRYGLWTIRGMVHRFAPPTENDTDAYVKAVSADTGFGADDWIHLREPSVMKAMAEAFIKHENGMQPYSDALIAQSVSDALA